MNKIKLGNKLFYYQVFYKNNKNMYLRVKDDLITITCNKRISISKIEDFILGNETKILRKFNSNEAREPLYRLDSMQIFGFELKIEYNLSCKKNSYSIMDDVIYITFRKDYYDNKYIETIYKELTINKINEYYSEIYNEISKLFDIDNVIFKTQLMKSRFGSCIPKKRIIKLNSILSRFDESYIKIILIHELIHLKVHNHQGDFYKFVNKLIPNYRNHIKKLNQLSRKYVI